MKTNKTNEEEKRVHEGGTEAPFSGEYWDMKKTGDYTCKSCEQILFSSDTKLDTSTGPMGLQGWPAFENCQYTQYNRYCRLGTNEGLFKQRSRVFFSAGASCRLYY
jgi:peptide methionine sulfoxide reductase MsrB